ncbi:hypothetical protein K4K59_010832 [Colletotrichum sp. SAR11_240]|nr:hypothetical protein K4K59_010832 [Colletotrichum sp. SAR11_240]
MSNTSGVITALPAPEGYVVDFDNPQRRDVVESYVVVGIGMFLALLFLLQRLYVKIIIRKKFGLDDVLLLFGWKKAFTVAIQALMIKAALEGYVGVHGWEIPIEKFKDFTFWNSYINPIVYAIPPGACKMVILLFFLELNNNAKWFRWTVITSVVRLYLLITILADADQTWGGIFINIWVRDEPEYDMDTFHVQIKGGPRERDVERAQMKDSGGTWNDPDSSKAKN